MAHHFVRAFTIGLLVLVLSPNAFAQSWSVHPQVSPPRSRTALAAVNGKIYVIGGQVTDQSCTSRVDIYNPASKQWSKGADAPKQLCGHAVVVVGKIIYSFGGSDGNKGSDIVLRYDPAADQWTALPTKLPVPRTYHAAVADVKGRVYLVGGQTTGEALAQVDEFDPVSNGWTTRANLPVPFTHISGTRGPCDGSIYVLAQDTFQRFDPATNTWSVLPPLPEIRSGVALVAGPDNRLYALGGFGGKPFESAGSFIFNGSTWNLGSPMPTARGEHSAVTFGTRIFAIGGWGKFPGIMGANEALGPIKAQLCPERPDGGAVAVRPRPCGWTPWLNRDLPGGSGDYETRADFVKAGSACAKPQRIECRVRATQQSWQGAGQAYTCVPEVGGVCVNSKQPSGSRCLDYEVRFCCLPTFDP